MGYDIASSNTDGTEIGIQYDNYKESKEGLSYIIGRSATWIFGLYI